MCLKTATDDYEICKLGKSVGDCSLFISQVESKQLNFHYIFHSTFVQFVYNFPDGFTLLLLLFFSECAVVRYVAILKQRTHPTAVSLLSESKNKNNN